MVNKIRYPRTTLEICDVTLDVLRRGLALGFSSRYPEIDCYNGRQWKDLGGDNSIYYVRTAFQARFFHENTGVQGLDVRMVIVRNSNDSLNDGVPFFWCSVWYKVGELISSSKPPSQYHPDIHQRHFHCPRWNDRYWESVYEFDPMHHFQDLDMLQAATPPPPIQF